MDAIDRLRDLLSYLTEPPYSYYAAATASLLALLWILRSFRKSHRGIVPFKTQGGTIEIAPQTVRGILHNVVQSVDGVHKCSCTHFTKRDRIGIKVSIHLLANHSLRQVETTIKERIRSTLMDQFGMDTVDPINIRVARIVGKPITHEQYVALNPVTVDPATSANDSANAGLDTPEETKPHQVDR
jgi:uncharacterized alkaline shock family protein YloU